MKYDLCMTVCKDAIFRTPVSFSCWRDSVGDIINECYKMNSGFEEVLNWHDATTLGYVSISVLVPYSLLC